MDKEVINEMIERQGVYEITYKKDEDVKIRHISNIMISPDYGDSCISAYCNEACKELTFNTKKILSIKEYWIGIMSKDETAPQNGMYLIARGGLGQGIDIEYEFLELKEGESFESRERSWDVPIAYHYIPSFGKPEGNWIQKVIIMKKWEDEKIPAPMKGIPIIAYSELQEENLSKDPATYKYFYGGGIFAKNDDISEGFKEWNSAGPFGRSEHYDGYKILGFMMVCEYDLFACRQHIEQRLKIEPDFFE